MQRLWAIRKLFHLPGDETETGAMESKLGGEAWLLVLELGLQLILK